MTDCIIIGSGLAGISAALTLQANGKGFQIFGNKNLSDKILRAEKIHNYPALADVSGEEFCHALKNQLEKAEISVTEESCGDMILSEYLNLDGGDILTDTGAIASCHKMRFI